MYCTQPDQSIPLECLQDSSCQSWKKKKEQCTSNCLCGNIKILHFILCITLFLQKCIPLRVLRLFGELTSGKRKQGRPLKRFKDCIKASISHAKTTPKELEPRSHDRTGWRALTRHAMDTFEERCCTQIEEARERRKASADAPNNPSLFPCQHCPWTCKSRIGLCSHLCAQGRREQRWKASLSILMDYYYWDWILDTMGTFSLRSLSCMFVMAKLSDGPWVLCSCRISSISAQLLCLNEFNTVRFISSPTLLLPPIIRVTVTTQSSRQSSPCSSNNLTQLHTTVTPLFCEDRLGELEGRHLPWKEIKDGPHFPWSTRPVTLTLELDWLPCKTPGISGSVGLVSVYCDWVRQQVWSASSTSSRQYIQLSE